MTKKFEEFWLIWSIEHRGWWGPSHRGYVSHREFAGRYTREEAEEIVRGANHFHNDQAGPPYEAMVPEDLP